MNYTSERALFASNALVYLAIAFGVLSFWSDAVTAGDFISYLIAGLLTVAFGSVSFLLSGVVIRYAEAVEKEQEVTGKLVVFFGIVLGLIEAGMTHLGLQWLDARKHLAPDWALVIVSLGLSSFNVFSLYTFAREIKAKKPATKANALDNQLWGIQPTGPHSVIRPKVWDANTKATMDEIGARVNAAN